jgi:pimeloyl-ACP methyl ester carboxylesterase
MTGESSVSSRRRGGIARPIAKVVAVLALSACASGPPLSVRPGDPETARAGRAMNALTSGRPSEWTRILLRRQDLLQLSRADPEVAIERLHELAAAGEATPEALFALAELSFLFAREKAPDGGSRRAHYLASAVYAWAVLFGGGERDEIARVDPRGGLAAELYNHAIAAALRNDDGDFEPRAGLHSLPFGTLDISFDLEALEWGRRRLTELQPAAGLEVRGLRNRYRQPGIGAPLLATAVPREPWPQPDDLALAETVVNVTAVLALPEPRAQLRRTKLRGRLALYRGHESTSLNLAGRRAPLEIEPSVALAATLERSGVWRGQLSAFLGRAVGVQRPARIFALKPLLPGQTPVVFVHGTNSDPSVWANMANDLLSDPKIRERFSFWFFGYDSGNPILYSGMMLRRALREIVSALGPSHAYPCLQDMVVIGHSQGGLLTKITAVDSGTRFWEAVADQPFDQVELQANARALLQEALFLEPLPFVRRVVFIATPHGGSFLASPAIVGRLARRLIMLPHELVDLGIAFAGLEQRAPGQVRVRRVSTSLDNMSPGNIVIRTLAEIPIAPGVAQHSIVAVRGSGPAEEGDDGVVRFSSAHRPDADSELIVRSGHSTQSSPHTINEVARILRLHAEHSNCQRPASRHQGDGDGRRAHH